MPALGNVRQKYLQDTVSCGDTASVEKKRKWGGRQDREREEKSSQQNECVYIYKIHISER